MLTGLAVCGAGPCNAQAAASAATSATPSLKLVRVVLRLKDGAVWAKEGMSGICGVTVYELRWSAAQSELRTERAAAVFSEEVTKAGLSKQAGENLFEDAAPANELQIAVAINDMNAQFCGFEDDAGRQSVRGTMTLSSEWQVYDPLRREIIARIPITAKGEEKERSFEGKTMTFLAAFRESAKALIATPEFQKAIHVAPPGPSSGSSSAFEPIRLMSGAGPTPIADAAGAVVTIFAGDAFGSGVLISSDGYVLTNHHVVGTAPKVRVRWSDGFETTADVIRTNKGRDVALVKTEPHGRRPLSLNTVVPPTGTSVFAIGAPLDPHLQSTVTRGIVSASRIVNGFSFIQSDTPVTHGNSGGPLLDETGAVVGLTDWGIPASEGSVLNFFIPIGDALDFLALKTGN